MAKCISFWISILSHLSNNTKRSVDEALRVCICFDWDVFLLSLWIKLKCDCVMEISGFLLFPRIEPLFLNPKLPSLVLYCQFWVTTAQNNLTTAFENHACEEFFTAESICLNLIKVRCMCRCPPLGNRHKQLQITLKKISITQTIIPANSLQPQFIF